MTERTSTSRYCPKCGKPLSASAPRGLCVACLFRSAAKTGTRPGLATLPRRLGDYEVLEFIARGGMGLVYKARHVPLDRLVALKIIALGEMAAPDFVERFRIEAKAAASLDHPNIVSIYEVGEAEGRQFFSMRLIEGRSLTPHNGDEPAYDSPPAIAALMAKIARAVHYAHQRGILHRDIKPGNILLDARGEPFLTDFGLAKLVAGDSDVTHSLAVLGTPAYMSPEQARGKTKQLTTAADIYSLGAVLYELLAGQPPFTGESSVEILRKVIEQEPTPPLRLRAESRKPLTRPSATLSPSDGERDGVRGVSQTRGGKPSISPTSDSGSRLSDLQLICLKCLNKEPERRYHSAEALAEDLERWLRREPIAARPTTGVERAWLWCRRKPRQAAMLGVLAVVIIAGVAGVLTQWRRAESNRERAEQNSRRLEAEKAATRLNLYASDMSAAMAAWRDGNFGLARRLLDAQRPEPGAPNDLRGFEWRFLWQQVQGDQVKIFRGHSNLITSVAISPDARRIVSGSLDGRVSLWDVETGRMVKNLNPRSVTCLSVAFSRDGNHVAAGLNSGFFLADLRTGDVREDSRRRGAWLATSPMADLLLVGNGSTYWYGTGGSARLLPLEGNAANEIELPKAGGRVAISGDGRIAATGLFENRISFWKLPTGELLGQVTNINSLSSFALARDGSWLAAAVDFSPNLRVWSVPDGLSIANLSGHELTIEAVAASASSDLVATAGRDQKILLWDIGRRERVGTLIGHENEVHGLAISRDDQWLASGGKDETVRWWRLGSASNQNTIAGLSVRFGFGAPLISPDGALLAATTQAPDWEFKLFDARTLKEVRTLARTRRALAFSPDSKLLVSLSFEQRLDLWEVASGVRIGFTRLPVKPAAEAMSALSPAGDAVAIGGDGRVTVCDTRTGQMVAELARHNGWILSLAFSRDGRHLVTTGQDDIVRVWDVSNWSNVTTLRHKWHVRALAFSPDDRFLASAGHDNVIKIWEVGTWREVGTLMGSKAVVRALAFTSDGKTLLSASEDAVRFWNVATWREVGVFIPPMTAQQLILSPTDDAFALAEAFGQGPLHFWRAPSLATIEGRAAAGDASTGLPRVCWVLSEMAERVHDDGGSGGQK